MRWREDLGHHEGRQGYVRRTSKSHDADMNAEFSGTLQGFDDFVSMWDTLCMLGGFLTDRRTDMVLEDVTE